MIFSDDFLNALNVWQRGWNENLSLKEGITKSLVKECNSLPSKYKEVQQACFRKRFLRKGELFSIIMVDERDEGISSWTINKEYAEIFKGIQKVGAVSGAIFQHMPLPSEVVLNICSLWECEDFKESVKRYNEKGEESLDALDHFKASQGEVILSSPLKGSEIVALTGASSPFDELCDTLNIPEEEREARFKNLVDKGIYPGEIGYTSEEGTKRVIQKTIKGMNQVIIDAQKNI